MPEGRALDIHKALADDTRFRLYRYVGLAGRPVSVREMSRRLSLHPNTLRPHLRRLEEAMARAGFQPRFRRLQGSAIEVTLRECPFRELTEDHRDLACTLHRGLIEGMVSGLKPPLVVKEFHPLVERGICRVQAV